MGLKTLLRKVQSVTPPALRVRKTWNGRSKGAMRVKRFLAALVLIAFLAIAPSSRAQTSPASQIEFFLRLAPGDPELAVYGAFYAMHAMAGLSITEPVRVRDRIRECLGAAGRFQKATLAQLRAIVVKSLQEHPENWNVGIGPNMVLAFVAACP